MGSLGNTQLWGSIMPGGDPDVAGGIDTQEVVDRLLPTLHADSRATLTFWSEGDLIQWMDEAVKRLARLASVFVGRSATILSVATQAAYGLPVRHFSTLHVSYLTTPLRPASTIELEARNPAYQTAAGTPDHWYEDLQGGLSMALTPVPDTSDQAIPVIYEGWPATLDAGKQQTLVPAPAPVKEYLAMCVLAEAYGREGEMEMPDVAKHCRDRMAMYEQVFSSYYGAGI